MFGVQVFGERMFGQGRERVFGERMFGEQVYPTGYGSTLDPYRTTSGRRVIGDGVAGGESVRGECVAPIGVIVLVCVCDRHVIVIVMCVCVGILWV